jgi:AcrR family transcriptional regulator
MPIQGKTKKEIVSEFRSLEILEAARGVFASKGFNNATMDDVAEAAGVAKGTLYLYFPSKREIFLETFRQGAVALQEEVRRNMDLQEDTAAKICAFIRTRLEYGERNRDFFRIYYTEFNNMLTHPAPVRQEFQDLYNRQANALAEVLKAGIERKQVRKMDPLAGARIVYDTTRGWIAQRLLGWSQSSVEHDADFVFDVIWKGIGCPKR